MFKQSWTLVSSHPSPGHGWYQVPIYHQLLGCPSSLLSQKHPTSQGGARLCSSKWWMGHWTPLQLQQQCGMLSVMITAPFVSHCPSAEHTAAPWQILLPTCCTRSSLWQTPSQEPAGAHTVAPSAVCSVTSKQFALMACMALKSH